MECMTLWTTIALFSALIVARWLYRRLTTNLPPGPFRWPFIGSALSHDLSDLVGSFAVDAKQYGPLVTNQFGPYTTVLLSDPYVIKEAFSKDVFVPRPQFWGVVQRRIMNNNTHGLIFADGEAWKEHRRFVLQTFRDFGVGKIGMEDKIVAEAKHVLQALANSDGQPLDNKVLLSTAVANMIAAILSGRRYEVSDPIFQDYLAHVNENFRISPDKLILEFWPWTRYLPGIRATKDKFFETQGAIKTFLARICEDHLHAWVPGQSNDLLDTYLCAIKSGQYKTFSKEEIPLILEDLFEAGYETTTTTLRWAFLMMCLNPDVQKRVQQELDDVVPCDVIPRPSDKYSMPYFDATLQEVHRYGSIAPTGVDHCAAEDTTLLSYTIPKGTWLIPNLHYVHHNDEWWDRPDQFDPTRFLGPDGEKKAVDFLMPFSVGKRRCVGEALAKAEVYTLFAAVLQKFTLQLPQGIKTVSLKPVPGITADTQKHQIRYIPRKQFN